MYNFLNLANWATFINLCRKHLTYFGADRRRERVHLYLFSGPVYGPTTPLGMDIMVLRLLDVLILLAIGMIGCTGALHLGGSFSTGCGGWDTSEPVPQTTHPRNFLR